jgi:hypothetical protein
MDRRQVIGILGSGLVASLQAAPSARDRLPGIYKLLYWRTTNQDGTVTEPLGQDPIGRVTYHKSGHMSVMLMRRDRKAAARINPRTASDEEVREALRQAQAANSGFIAYMGTYELQEERSIVIHHIEGGSSPTFAGTDFERRYEFTSKGIYLMVPPNFNSKLEWERIADA